MSSRTAIDKVNKDFIAAMAEGDAAGVAACYTEDGHFMVPNIATLEGRAAITAGIQSLMDSGISSIDLETTEVEDHGDTAIELGKYTLKAAGNIADKGRFMVIWKCIDGKWYLHRDIINSTMPAPHE